MSHITACASKVVLKNEQWIKDAIALMAKDFPGLTYEQKTPGLIQIRYTPIEVYQHKGNTRFIKNPDQSWTMQDDVYRCSSEIERIRKSFVVNYQKAGVLAYCKKNRFTQSSQTTEKGSRIIATEW